VVTWTWPRGNVDTWTRGNVDTWSRGNVVTWHEAHRFLSERNDVASAKRVKGDQ
jgi:hypothetical protein